MDFLEVEKKWQKKWKETGLYKFEKNSQKPKYYMLEMFSYPSGAKLHVGHWFNYGPSDSFARYKRMKGFNVFHPMGFDAFGLPAENYAIKTGVHPKDSTEKNMDTMKKQLGAIGATFDWDYSVETCNEDYYRWTQWCFLKLYEKGLAYRKQAPVNWCNSCNTVLANEQVIDGECERCGTQVVRKNLTQWFFKITDYAQELLDGLDDLDWPDKTKQMQRNWIGRSEGARVTFSFADTDINFDVFTTRIDTLCGCTYVVLAPESELVDKIVTNEQRKAVEDYRLEASKASEIDRMSDTREKTGVFTGAYAINPINNERVPVYIADYVLAGYGTGCVMAVPAHDERDFEFATKFNLPIKRVIEGGELPFCDESKLVNSGEFDGLQGEKAKDAIISKLGSKAERKINYRLRDWLVSRQRYWGAPIPIIHCDKCGAVPVPEEDLPVKLPYDVDFTPDGTSPLLKHEGFMNVKCPKCGCDAKRDADTMDTFVCSSWYFLRYPDCKNDKEAFNKQLIDSMLPVDKYVGGAEHACMHLLYARFFTKAFRDMGLLSFDEPFSSLVHQGLILGPDGNKMSKSKGNVISPDDYVEEYGSDVFRMYLLFGFKYIEGGPFSTEGVQSMRKFLDRVHKTVLTAKEAKNAPKTVIDDLNYQINYAIKAVSEDAEKMQFNTCVARIMEVVNVFNKVEDTNNGFLAEVMNKLLLIMAPFAPHFCEEMWEIMGNEYSIFNQSWPEYDKNALHRSTIELGVQINGKVKAVMEFGVDDDAEAMKAKVLENEKIKRLIEGKTVVKVITVPKKIVSLVVK
ncbi:MAG: leucine--tRNA ligase [Clostridia bacterium]|nr:leucine--tRNA ligase [Clostridia bacterium]